MNVSREAKNIQIYSAWSGASKLVFAKSFLFAFSNKWSKRIVQMMAVFSTILYEALTFHEIIRIKMYKIILEKLKCRTLPCTHFLKKRLHNEKAYSQFCLFLSGRINERTYQHRVKSYSTSIYNPSMVKPTINT